MNKAHQSKASKLSEGLRTADLKDMIEDRFSVDQYESKMGEDRNIIVLRFRAADKEPAIDLMEFIEKGYPFVLDSDISSGEERDGKYSIFVELERSDKAPEQINDLLNGMNQLCERSTWRFRWYKDIASHEFTRENFAEIAPLSPEEYDERTEAEDHNEIAEFFDQGAIDSITITEDKTLIFEKTFASPLELNFLSIGDYEKLSESLPGAISLDEASRGQMLFLNKYLGNYDITKIGNKFLIRNNDRAVVVSKEVW